MSTRDNSNPLYESIRGLVLSARESAARGVNLLQVYTNYEIGRLIFEQEQQGADRAGYGKELLNELAARLTGELGSGFSRTNLASMRQFYMTYPDRIPKIIQTTSGQFSPLPIVQTPSGQLLQDADHSQPPFFLSWSHYVFLIGLRGSPSPFSPAK